MLFADDTEVSLRAAVALVNSAAEPDTLTEISQLDAFYEEQGTRVATIAMRPSCERCEPCGRCCASC